MSFGEDVGALVAENSFGVLACAPGWERVPLGKLVKIVNGYPFESKFFSTGAGTPLARIRDVVRGRSDTFYSGPVPDGFWVRPGELLVGMDGDFNSAHWRQGDALLNQRVCKLEASTERLNPAFLAYGLPGYLELINRHTSSVTVKHLSSKTLQQVPFPVPPRELQDQIVARIDGLFAEIDEGERALAEARAGVETYRKALLKAAVTGELTADWRAHNPARESGQDLLRRLISDRRARLERSLSRAPPSESRAGPDFADLPELPDAWIWTTVEQLGAVSGGLTQNSKRSNLALKIPFLRVANVYAGRLRMDVIEEIGLEEKELSRSLLEKDDLLIVEGNGSIDQIGRSAVWTGEISRCAHQNHLIKVRFIWPGLADWVQTWLQSPHGRRELEEAASSTSGLHTLSISKVARLRCPLPPIAELREVLARTARGRTAIADSSATLNGDGGDAASLRQSILAAAFRGDLA